MSAISTIVWKEVRETRRDPVTMSIAVLLPLLMLYLFGSALSLDVKDAALAVFDLDRSPQSRALVDAFPNSGYFRIVEHVSSEHDVHALLDHGRVSMVLIIPPDFSERLARGETAAVQTLADGSFSATAMVVVNYADAIIESYGLEHLRHAAAAMGIEPPAAPVEVESRVWFNAPLESANYIIPGLFGVILMAFPPLLTTLAVVREKESGSVHQIFVSPIRPYEFIAGKMIPYAAIAFLQMVMIFVAGVWWFRVPFTGSLALFLAATVVYVFCTVGLGLLVSSVTRSQLAAMLLALVLTLMPSFLFSGFIFPIFTMPVMLQMYTYLFPGRYFVDIARGIAMKNAGLSILWPQLLALTLYTITVFAVTACLFRKKVA